MRTFIVCGLLTVFALDLVILSWLVLHGWPTRAVLTESGWSFKQLAFTATDIRIASVILLANLVFGCAYLRSRSRKG